MRVRPLPTEVVERALVQHVQADAKRARIAARLSQGSIGKALAFLPDGDEPGALEALRLEARELLAAATSPNAAARLAAAHATAPSGARGSFLDTLDFLSLWIRDLAAVAEGADDLVVNADALKWLKELSVRHPGAARGAADAVHLIEHTRGLTTFNINPQLALASLLRELSHVLGNGKKA